MRGVHGVYLAVLRARKTKEDESSLLFPGHRRNDETDTYPYPWY